MAGVIAFGLRWILNRETELRKSLREEVTRERGISAQWREAHDTRAAADERRDRLLWQVMDSQGHLMRQVEYLTSVVTATMAGGPGSPAGGATRTRPSESRELL
jgi:hypothetical protein